MSSSLRKMRRAQARADAKLVNWAESATHVERRAALMRQGISPEDVAKEAKEQYHAGYMRALDVTTNQFLASMVVAAHKAFGFGADRCLRLCNETTKTLAECIDTQEAVQKAFDQVGLELVPDDPWERVKLSDKKAKVRVEGL